MGVLGKFLGLYKPGLSEKFNLNEHWNRNTDLIEDFAASTAKYTISKVEVTQYDGAIPTRIVYYRDSKMYMVSTVSKSTGSLYTDFKLELYNDDGITIAESITAKLVYVGSHIKSISFNTNTNIDIIAFVNAHNGTMMKHSGKTWGDLKA